MSALPTGVLNAGNTCWMGASVQLLKAMTVHFDVMATGLRNQETDPEEVFLFEALLQVMQGASREKSEKRNVERLVAAFLRVYPDPAGYGVGMEHDAAETFMRLLDLVGRVVPSAFDLTHGYLIQTMNRQCGHTSYLEEHIAALEILAFNPIAVDASVSDLVTSLLSGVQVDCRCSQCEVGIAEKSSTLGMFPKYLTVSLARKTSSGFQGAKVHRSCSLKFGSTNYRLIGEVLFRRDPAHYVTIREHGDQLFLFNDSLATPWTQELEEVWDAPGSVRLALYEQSERESLFTDPDSEGHEQELVAGVSDQEVADFVQEAEQIEGLSQMLRDVREESEKFAPTSIVLMGDPMWTCPFQGCGYQHLPVSVQTPQVAKRRYKHVRSCPQQQAKALLKQHPEWTAQQVEQEVHSRLEPSFLEREQKKWCPGLRCLDILAVRTTCHKKCGWGLVATKDPLVSLLPEGRASDQIEAREPPALMDLGRTAVDGTMCNMPAAMETVRLGALPPLEEVALLPKWVHNPNNRALSPALGLLWARCLTFTLQIVIMAKELSAAWTLWFMLAQCTLFRQEAKLSKHEWESAVADRMIRWMQGDFVKLWAEAKEALSKLEEHLDKEQDVEAEEGELESMRRRVEQLMRAGRYSDAAGALLAENPAELTKGNVAILRGKFPYDEDALGSMAVDVGSLRRIRVEANTVESCLQSFPKGSSGGLSGIVPESVASAQRYAVGFGIPLMESLAKVVETVANGEAPMEVAAWLVGGRLIPVGVKIRPVVVSDSLGRLVSKVVRASQEHLFPKIFGGLQGGVGESCAVDRTIHLLREDLVLHERKLDHGVLAVDFRNGFNEVSRATVAEELRLRCPDMLPWFRWSYGRAVELVLRNKERIQCRKGVCQGDPLSPFLFSINLQPVLKHIKQTWEEQGLCIIRAFLDDGVFSGPVTILMEILEFLMGDEVRSRGLHIRLDKCVLYIPSAGLPDSVHRDYDLPAALQVSTDGVVALGVPLGSPDFVERFLYNIVANVRTFHNRLAELGAPQLALVLLRLCGGATKVSHLLRCMPPDQTAAMCQAVDDSSDQEMLRVMGLENKEDLTPTQWQQAHLPMSMGGLGIPPTSSVKEAAYLASFIAVSRSVDALHSTRSASLSNSLQSATQNYNLLVAGKDKISTEAVLAGAVQPKASLQRELTGRVYRHSFDCLMRDASLSKVDWGRITDQTRAGSSGWMNAVFAGRNLVIGNDGFQLLLRRHLGYRFFAEGTATKCSRSGLKVASQRMPCDIAQDPFMYHATDLCKTGFVHRHNTVANDLKRLCFLAGLQCQSEVQCIPGSLDVPADLYIHCGPDGIPVAVDMSVGSPVCSTATSHLTLLSKAGAYLRLKEMQKCAKYKTHFASMKGTIRYIPFVVSTFGGVAPKATEVVSFISSNLAERWRMPLQAAHSFISKRISASVMNLVSLSLSHAVASHRRQHLVAQG